MTPWPFPQLWIIELYGLVNTFSYLLFYLQGDSPQGQAVAKRLAEKISLLQGKIESAITSQVADNFMDPYTPIKELEIAAKAPLGE